jgi:hypothetical protein
MTWMANPTRRDQLAGDILGVDGFYDYKETTRYRGPAISRCLITVP